MYTPRAPLIDAITLEQWSAERRQQNNFMMQDQMHAPNLRALRQNMCSYERMTQDEMLLYRQEAKDSFNIFERQLRKSMAVSGVIPGAVLVGLGTMLIVIGATTPLWPGIVVGVVCIAMSVVAKRVAEYVEKQRNRIIFSSTWASKRYNLKQSGYIGEYPDLKSSDVRPEEGMFVMLNRECNLVYLLRLRIGEIEIKHGEELTLCSNRVVPIIEMVLYVPEWHITMPDKTVCMTMCRRDGKTFSSRSSQHGEYRTIKQDKRKIFAKKEVVREFIAKRAFSNEVVGKGLWKWALTPDGIHRAPLSLGEPEMISLSILDIVILSAVHRADFQDLLFAVDVFTGTGYVANVVETMEQRVDPIGSTLEFLGDTPDRRTMFMWSVLHCDWNNEEFAWG